MRLLLGDPRVDPSAQNNYAARISAQGSHFETLEVLLADPRVDGTPAIGGARDHAVHVLLDDERVGVQVNRGLFLRHHRSEVARFDELASERTEKVCAVSWVMKQIGQGWNDLREPIEARLRRETLDWNKK